MSGRGGRFRFARGGHVECPGDVTLVLGVGCNIRKRSWSVSGR